MDEPSPTKYSPRVKALITSLQKGDSGAVLRGMGILALGSGVGRAIGIVTIPLLTRLYTPEDFGVLSVFTALVSIIAPLVTLRYVLAVPLPRHDGMAMNLLMVALAAMLGFSALVTLLLWLWGEPLLKMLSMQALVPWWWLIALGVFGTAAYETMSLWATRRRAYKDMARTQVTQSFAGAAVKVVLGFAGLHPVGLLLGQVVAQTGGVLRLGQTFAAEFRAGWRHVSLSRMRRAAWYHRGLPTWRVPSQLFLMLSMQAPVLAFSRMYDSASTGQLGLAFTALAIPIAVLGETTSKVYFAEISKIGPSDPARILRLTLSTLRTMLIAALAPTTILLLFGENIFAIVLGEKWAEAGRFAQVLSVYLLMQFLSNPISRTLSVLRMEWAYFFINIQRVVLILGGFIVSGWLGHTPELTLMVFVVLTSLHQLSVVSFILLTLKRRIRPLARL